MVRNAIRHAALLAALVVLPSSCGLQRHKYDNPITKDTQQPDKVLFDKAIDDIEHGRFEVARLTLQTLMNTYDTSEYLAKAKLAMADSWFREGGAHGLAQAEAEYKDFILFYPAMEEAAEAQEKICDIHYKQMEKADRDPMHALRAEDECRQLLVQFPNSKFAPEAQQKLRDIQEVLADAEFRTGTFYHTKGSFPAAANRFQGMADQFPLYSQADEALWQLADSYQHMGDRFENQQAAAYTRIVKDYPLSAHADAARAKLKEMNRPVPEADPVAYARMKYELENHTKTEPDEPLLWGFPHQPQHEHGGQVGKPADDRPAAHHPGQRSAGCRGHPGRELRGLRLHGGRQFRHRQESRRARQPPRAGRRRRAIPAHRERHRRSATQPAAAPPPPPVQQSTVTRTGSGYQHRVRGGIAEVAWCQQASGAEDRCHAALPVHPGSDPDGSSAENHQSSQARRQPRPRRPGEKMSRILLVDDSPHAQRMGERILSDEGYEVVTVSNADSALIRLEDADPDVVVADAVMPGRTGYDICQYLKMSPRHRHVRVILTSGAQEPIDEARAQLVQADGALEKPFEASALLAAVKPLAEARGRGPGAGRRHPPAAAADRAPGAAWPRRSSPWWMPNRCARP